MISYGDEIAENGAANLGLKDQMKALEWVKQNIWAWGGDPDRVRLPSCRRSNAYR
jgi:carboxylesterase type B